MARRTSRPDLTPEQQAEADRLLSGMPHAAEGDLRQLAELLATKTDADTDLPHRN
jgi:predicted aconitase